tara:strand:- start:2880 stop:3041 length:162 start_codon:yes stop_codon:yes gene_type:complete
MSAIGISTLIGAKMLDTMVNGSCIIVILIGIGIMMIIIGIQHLLGKFIYSDKL